MCKSSVRFELNDRFSKRWVSNYTTPVLQFFTRPLSKGSSFDPLTTGEDVLVTAEEHIGRSHVVERFVLAVMVVMLDELSDRLFQATGSSSVSV